MGGRAKKHKKAPAAATSPADPPPALAEEAEAEAQGAEGSEEHATPQDDADAHHSKPLSPKQPGGSPHRASTKHHGKHHHRRRHRRRNPDPDPSEQKQEEAAAPVTPADAAPDAPPPPAPPSPEPPLQIFRGEWMQGFHLLLPVGDRLLLRVRRQTAHNFSMIQCLYWKSGGGGDGDGDGDGDGTEQPSLSLIDEWKVQGAVEGGARVGLECKWSGESAVVLYVLPTKKAPNVVFYCYTMSIYTAVGDFAMEHVRLNRTLRQTFRVEEPTNTTHVALEDGTAVCYAEPSGAVAVYTLRLCPSTLAVQLSPRPRTLRALHAHYTHVALRPSRRGRHEVVCFSQTTGATAIHPLVFGTDEQLQAYAAVIEGTRPQPEERRRCSRMVVVPGCQEAPSAPEAAPQQQQQQQQPCEDAVDSTESAEAAAAAPFPPRAASTILFYKHFVRAENPAIVSPMMAAAVVMATSRSRPSAAQAPPAGDGELLEFQQEKQGGDAATAGAGAGARGDTARVAAQQEKQGGGGGGGGPNAVDAGLLKLSHRMSDTVLLPRLVETFAFLWTAVVPWPVASDAACDRRPAVVCYEESSGAVLVAEVLQQGRKILVDSGKNTRWLSPPRRARERHAAAAARSYFRRVPPEMAGLTTAAVATSPPRGGGGGGRVRDESAAELPPPHVPTRYQAEILSILRGMKGRPRDVRTDYYLESAAKEVVSRHASNSQSLNPVALCLEAAADGGDGEAAVCCAGRGAAAGASPPRDWGAAAAIARLQKAKLAAFDTLADGEAASRSDPPALRRARHAQARSEKPMWVHCSKPPARIVTPPLGTKAWLIEGKVMERQQKNEARVVTDGTVEATVKRLTTVQVSREEFVQAELRRMDDRHAASVVGHSRPEQLSPRQMQRSTERLYKGGAEHKEQLLEKMREKYIQPLVPSRPAVRDTDAFNRRLQESQKKMFERGSEARQRDAAASQGKKKPTTAEQGVSVQRLYDTSMRRKAENLAKLRERFLQEL